MQTSLNDLITFHQRRDEFIAATQHTSNLFGFNFELIEKDYLCTAVLMYLFDSETLPLIFKGGTSLAKVHAGFYRLSEDLDFTISISSDAKRSERSQLVKPIKNKINTIENTISIIKVQEPLSGRNESRQYSAQLHYKSNFSSRVGRILIDIGLREENIDNPVIKTASTLLRNPFTDSKIITDFDVSCLSVAETYAEKIRAAISREKLAIRDFYDLHHALKNNIIALNDPRLITIVKTKLLLPETNVITFNKHQREYLTQKIDTELLPTLSQSEKYDFDLPRIITALKNFIDTNKLNLLIRDAL